MSPRLLSFLTDFESSLGSPESTGGTWQSTRAVNNRMGVARLNLSKGAVQLQAHRLADGSVCLKAFLSWSGSAQETVHTIFERPGLDWRDEARKLAGAWVNGRETVVPEFEAAEPLAAAV